MDGRNATRPRLDASVFGLAVKKIRGGWYSDAYFNYAKEEHERYSQWVRCSVSCADRAGTPVLPGRPPHPATQDCLGITSAYLRGIDNTEIIHTVQRPALMITAARAWSAETLEAS
jgi:hypothetical protein